MEQPTHRASIESDIPGRIRVRLGHKWRNKNTIQDLHETIKQQNGISQVATNDGTGSVLIHYDKNKKSHNEIMSVLHDAGVLLRGTAGAFGLEVPDSGNSSQSRTSDNIIETLSDLDNRLRKLTGRRIDLKLLFPLLLTAIGVRRFVTGGLGIAEVPAYILFWYAFDLFWKLHNKKPVRT